MEVPLVRESDNDAGKGPIWKDSADVLMRGTDLRLICGPAFEVMLYKSQGKRLCPGWLVATPFASIVDPCGAIVRAGSSRSKIKIVTPKILWTEK